MGLITSKKVRVRNVPMNNEDIDRDVDLHYICREVWGKKDFSSPVENLLEKGAQVLDIGCGSGTWILEQATEYESSNFIGVDVEKYYPSLLKPQNTSFRLANILNGLPFKDNQFDFVHMRFMMLEFTLEDWTIAIKEMIRVCKPNGWIEIMEDDLEFHNRGPKTDMLMNTISEQLKIRGLETKITPYIYEQLNENPEINLTKDERFSRLGSLRNKEDKKGDAHLRSLKWEAKNLAKVMQPNLSNGNLTYEQIIEGFVEECTAGNTFVTSKRFYAKKKGHNKRASWRKFFRLKRFCQPKIKD